MATESTQQLSQYHIPIKSDLLNMLKMAAKLYCGARTLLKKKITRITLI